MFEWIRSTLNPHGYHGHVFRPPFFEGWYFKIVDRSERYKFAIIPGIYKSADEGKSHAFVQVLDGFKGTAVYQAYPVEQFQASPRGFELRVANNLFSAGRMALDVDVDGKQMRGELSFANPAGHPWPITLFSPGIMGWYSWVPRMECYHGVVSLDHGLDGTLEIGGERVDFGGGRGYIEKDWGKSFPSAWIWMQSNHFDRPGVCVTASVANIPWLGSSFAGYIAGVLVDGRLFAFTTYNGTRLEHLAVNAQTVSWRLVNRNAALELRASRAAGDLLRAPTPGGMDRRIAETLDGQVEVRLWEHGREIYAGMGRNAGLEVVGDLPAVSG